MAQWEDAANSSVFSCVGVGKLFRVSASVGVITTQLLLLFLLLLPTIGVASRSISVGLFGYYQLARLLMTTAILLGIADSFSDIPGTKWFIIYLYPSRIFRERGGDAARAPKLRLLIYVSQRLHLPPVRASGSVGRHASRFHWLRPCTFTSVEVTLRLLCLVPADAPSGDVGRLGTTSWSSGLPLGVIYRSRIILSYA